MDFRVGSITDLPYPDASFEVVITNIMYHHLDLAEKRQAVAEIAHVLRGPEPVEIRLLFFVTGKLAMGISWGFLFVQAAGMRLTPFPVPAALEYVSIVLLLLGIAFVISAFLYLGSDSRFGVSDDLGGLRTTGIYRVCWNPMYLGFYLVTLASLVSAPHPVNIGCGLVGIVVHHRIVLAEERFLLKEHGAFYEVYRRRVRRYL